MVFTSAGYDLQGWYCITNGFLDDNNVQAWYHDS